MSLDSSNYKQQNGFTLIEVLVYLGLFILVVGGLLTTLFSIVQGIDRTESKSLVQAEGDFLLAKLNWAVAGATAVSAPVLGGAGNTLTVANSGTTLNFTLSSGDLRLQRGSGPVVVLNNSNVTVTTSGSLFTHSGTSSVESVATAFTVNTKTPNGTADAQDFQTTKYLRK